MSEVKTLKGRVIHKHKTEAQWYLDVYTTAGGTTKRAEPFVPKKGELIIYDPDSVYGHYRFKIGDDEKDVVALPFWQGNPAELSTTSKTIIAAINELKGRVDALPTTDSNTAHTHSQGEGLDITGAGGINGNTEYTLASPQKIGTGVADTFVTGMSNDGHTQLYHESIKFTNTGELKTAFLGVNSTSNTDMAVPAVNILHTGPKDGSSYADLMVLSGYQNAPYGFKFRTYGDGTAIIQSQRISGENGEKFNLSLNPNGGKVLANGVEVATKTIATQSAAGLMSAEDKKKLDSISGDGSSMTPITYSELKTLRDSGSLVPGMNYRITDYQCTTVQENTSAMNNQFDIIVQAISSSTLSEVASADHHEGDTYFANTNLGAWELKYCLDNDSTRFAWVLDTQQTLTCIKQIVYFVPGDILRRAPHMDGGCSIDGYQYAWATSKYMDSFDATKCLYTSTEKISGLSDLGALYKGDWEASSLYYYFNNLNTIEGKGVIYYMKDEFGNECPYDFKNITYLGSSIKNYDKFGLEAENYYPTFTFVSLLSYEQWGSKYGVSRNSSIDTTVEGIAYYGYTCSSKPSAWNNADFYITDEEISSSSIMYQIFDGVASALSFGGSIEILSALDTTMGVNNVQFNVIGINNKKYGQPGAARLNNIIFIGSRCFNNLLSTGCYNSTLGSECHNNIFGLECTDNIFGIGCSYNTFGNSCNSNVFANYCHNNTFSNNCSQNTFDLYSACNALGNNCYDNIFTNNCCDNILEGSNNSIRLGHTCSECTFETGCGGITIEEISGEPNDVKYVRVRSGLSSQILTPAAGLSFPQIYCKSGTQEILID